MRVGLRVWVPSGEDVWMARGRSDAEHLVDVLIGIWKSVDQERRPMPSEPQLAALTGQAARRFAKP